MSFQSQSGHVGFKTQGAKGTYADPATGGAFMKLRSGSLGGNRDLLIPDPEIGGGRDRTDAYLGPVSFGGEYQFYARMEALAVLLKGALGAVSSSVTGTGPTQVGTHVITPVDASLPWISVEERIGKTYEVFNYTDAKVSALHLEAEANGYLMGSATMVALKQTAGNTDTDDATAPYDNTPMIVGSNVVVKWDGANLPAKSFSLDITNNMETDDFRLGSLFLGDAPEKRREIGLGVKIRPNDSALWKTAMYGAPAATEAGGTTTKKAVQVVASTYEVIGTSATVYSLTIDVPVAIIRPLAVTPSGDDTIEHDMEIVALRPNPANPILTATVKNSLAAVS